MMLNRSGSILVRLEVAAAALTVVYGWVVTLGQLVRDGWIDGGGTALLLAMSALATVGAWVAFSARRTGRRSVVAAGLALVAVSPTSFAYVLNIAVLVLALVELGLAISDGDRSRRATDAH